jgi:hypothetical protein
MKRRLKLTPFAKITIVVLIIVGVRYLYLNQINLKNKELINFDEFIEKTKNIFNKTEKEKLNKKEEFSKKQDTIVINIIENDTILKIKSFGKTVIKRKNTNKNNTDTFLFNISKEKELIGKIIYTTK